MKHDELWKDMLHDALPPGATTAALQAMRSAGQRRRTLRRVIRAGGASLLLAVMATAILWNRSTLSPTTIALPARPNTPPKVDVHQLTDAELVARLKEADFGIVIASQKESRRLLIVSHAGAVDPAN